MLRKKYKILTLLSKYKFVDVGWRINSYKKCEYCKNSCLIIFSGEIIKYSQCYPVDDDITKECIKIKHNFVPLNYFKWDNSKDVKYKKL